MFNLVSNRCISIVAVIDWYSCLYGDDHVSPLVGSAGSTVSTTQRQVALRLLHGDSRASPSLGPVRRLPPPNGDSRASPWLAPVRRLPPPNGDSRASPSPGPVRRLPPPNGDSRASPWLGLVRRLPPPNGDSHVRPDPDAKGPGRVTEPLSAGRTFPPLSTGYRPRTVTASQVSLHCTWWAWQIVSETSPRQRLGFMLLCFMPNLGGCYMHRYRLISTQIHT